MRQTVESIKADLLRVPVSAYNRARHALDMLTKDPHPDDVQIALYRQVVESLAADGYAPDLAAGQPGPATQSYYANEVTNERVNVPGTPLGSNHPQAYASYTADTHSLVSASTPGSGNTPDPDIND